MSSVRRVVAIVDDDPGVCRALARLVRSLGCEPVVYGSGEALLEGAAGMSSHHVLLDLQMPGIRGAELIAALRTRDAAANVIVMTGLDRPGAREACLEAGAAAYVTKPLHRSDLERLLGAVDEQ
jgi:CheY-like chemotaxis protein